MEHAFSVTVGHLQVLLACLHATYLHHWSAHWRARGAPAYGDHLLFERLYTEMPEEIDTLAEKIVALGGEAAVHPSHLVPHIVRFTAHWNRVPGSEAAQALHIENTLQDHIRLAYEEVKAADEMTLGLDDYLMSLANTHETAIYLLQQRVVDARQASENPWAGWTFLRR